MAGQEWRLWSHAVCSELHCLLKLKQPTSAVLKSCEQNSSLFNVCNLNTYPTRSYRSPRRILLSKDDNRRLNSFHSLQKKPAFFVVFRRSTSEDNGAAVLPKRLHFCGRQHHQSAKSAPQFSIAPIGTPHLQIFRPIGQHLFFNGTLEECSFT